MDRLRDALGDRYAFERELGAGGSGTVYLVRERKHDRRVAMKVFTPELGAVLGTERFHREIQTASRLTHPNILTVLDSDVVDGLHFYTMPYVDGESLDRRLRREGCLALDTAVRIALEVASGLQHAHGEGVIHRDVKPGNILITGDHAYIADFGVARALERAGGERLTQTGIAVGTPAYMSPEQGFGGERLDGRTDVYALGCVLFEMLKGRPPFQARSGAAMMARHAMDAVPSLRIDDPGIPLFVERAVKKALAKDPADRFATPATFAETLSSKTLVEVVGRKRVAVLPPANAIGDPDQEFLLLGLQEALISRLAQGEVAVLARASVARYADSGKTGAEIARELGVDLLVESSVFRSADTVGIEARIVDGATRRGSGPARSRGPSPPS